MDPVGQASIACSACRRSVLEAGWALTKDVSAACPKTVGAIWRQASQSMQVESTKKSPGTFSGTRFFGFAMMEPPVCILRMRKAQDFDVLAWLLAPDCLSPVKLLQQRPRACSSLHVLASD